MPNWNFNTASSDWEKANWANGSPFRVGWLPNHIDFGGGTMQITLDGQNSFGQPYTSGEYRSIQFYKYGLYEVRMKPAKSSGTVSTFFTYCGPDDHKPHDEIDIEFLGQDTTQVQFNYHTNNVGENVNEFVYDLGFDAADDFHTYAFRWKPDSITWYVDGVQVHQETGARTGIPLPTHAGKMMMNLWTGDASTIDWLGPFSYNGPLVAEYDWVRFTPAASGGLV